MKNAVPTQESSLTPGKKLRNRKQQEKDTYICNALNPQHIPIGIKFRMPKWGAIPTHNNSKFSGFHPPDSHGSWIGSPIPQKCSPPEGLPDDTNRRCNFQQARNWCKTTLLWCALDSLFFVANLRCLRIGPPLLRSPPGASFPVSFPFFFHHNDALWLWRLWPTKRKQAHRERKAVDVIFFFHPLWMRLCPPVTATSHHGP